jgi:hypothetical protein
LVSDVLKETDDFFVRVEDSCQELARSATSSETDRTTPTEQPSRVWKELRIRRPDLVQDSLTLPLQRLREQIHELIQTSEDKETGEELMECLLADVSGERGHGVMAGFDRRARRGGWKTCAVAS